MKIRNGFVSNSSSSSFVIRGVKVKKRDLKNVWKLIVNNKRLNEYLGDENAVIADMAWEEARKRGIDIQDTRDFFDGITTDDMIVRKKICDMEDGVATEIPEVDDEEIKRMLERNFIKTDKLATYVQFISNDNY